MKIELGIMLVIIFICVRAYYVYRVILKIQIRAFNISKSYQNKITRGDSFCVYTCLMGVYWDSDKMLRNFWIWDINKMRN